MDTSKESKKYRETVKNFIKEIEGSAEGESAKEKKHYGITNLGKGLESVLWRRAIKFTFLTGYTFDVYHAVRETGLPLHTAERVVKRAAADARCVVNVPNSLSGYKHISKLIRSRMRMDTMPFPVL